jgi:hypothetical protein
MRKFALSLALASLFVAGALTVSAQSGPIPTNAYGYVPANPATLAPLLVQTDPTAGALCYNPVVFEFNYTTGSLWGCVTVPGTVNTSTAVWQIVAGTKGLVAGFSTVASAGTIAPITRYVNVTGTTTVNTITAPAATAAGADITLICTGACALGTSGNIAAAVTGVAGGAYPLTYGTDNKWHPIL